MTLTQMRYVYETYRAGSINKAAATCFISQSVISTSISKLETELGETIFFRSSEGIGLTQFGKSFLSCIIPILEQTDSLERFIKNREEKDIRTIHIASRGWFFVSRALSVMLEKYRASGIRIDYYEGLEADIEQYLAGKVYDIGLTKQFSCYRKQIKRKYDAMGLQFTTIRTGEIAVCVSPKNPLFYNPSYYIDAQELKNSIHIIFDYTDEATFADLSHRLNLPLESTRIIANSRQAAYEILSNTDSFFLTSNLGVGLNKDNIRSIDLSIPQRNLILKNTDIKSEFGWIKRKDEHLNDLYNEFISSIIEYVNNADIVF